MILLADSEGPGQTVWMLRPSQAFAICIWFISSTLPGNLSPVLSFYGEDKNQTFFRYTIEINITSGTVYS